jgi:hypothetical protein
VEEPTITKSKKGTAGPEFNKEHEHAAKSAEGSKHNNHNIRVHLGKYVHTTPATTKAAVSPITTNLNT